MAARPDRKSLPHAVPHWVPDGSVFFITVNCAQRGRNQLCRAEPARTIFEAVAHRHERGDWYVHLMVLMPDHLHALISFSREKDMRQTVYKWKEYVAKQSGIRWQRDFFDHRLRGGESREEKAHYIRMNPVRQGLVPRPEAWPFVWTPPA